MYGFGLHIETQKPLRKFDSWNLLSLDAQQTAVVHTHRIPIHMASTIPHTTASLHHRTNSAFQWKSTIDIVYPLCARIQRLAVSTPNALPCMHKTSCYTLHCLYLCILHASRAITVKVSQLNKKVYLLNWIWRYRIHVLIWFISFGFCLSFLRLHQTGKADCNSQRICYFCGIKRA